ncbi:hypothetical protein I8751_27445 [Nostocaceae cyanobacterium CENA357]|uniref:Uncharacterized protein n=1 Tax=Atlanticothrix silvestris CENA357 TaxID=1725252 RepID=A0A8J7L4H8_9CYAN|nr:hypothetical protein [Atlanticothrix silvestris]MBH8556010.1 hypothetical protein [Atlanticothrix silvestris CENA357]
MLTFSLGDRPYERLRLVHHGGNEQTIKNGQKADNTNLLPFDFHAAVLGC